MAETIFWLGRDLPSASTRIGPKAATLNDLAGAGFPVPPGFCLPVEIFAIALTPFADRIDALCATADLRDPHIAQHIAQAIAHLLHDLALPAGLQAELAAALPQLGSDSVAVRSSATLEDLAEVSFAGQYASVIGAQGAEEIAAAILTCWRSFFSANALVARAAYAAQPDTSGAQARPGMAVLIQPLLQADCAGVCFSVDPVHQRADLLLVTASWGLGVGVVAGSVPVDSARVRRSDFATEELFIAHKQSCIRYVAAEANSPLGLQTVAVPADQQHRACLPESWLRRVAHFALAAEQHLGSPQDMEWAIVGQQFWLLQSRPITTLSAEVRQATRFPIDWVHEAERARGWWLNHFNDRPGALLLPAEIAFVQACSTHGGQVAVELAGGAKTRWRKAVNGRIYMAVADSSVTPGQQRVRQAALRDLFARLEEQNVTLWEHWGPEIIRATERLDAFDPCGADSNALADHLEDTLAAAQRHWMIHTMTPRNNGCTGLLATYRQMTGKSEDEAAADLPFLVQGTETVQTRLIEALYDLAALALTHPSIVAELVHPTLDSYQHLQTLAGAEPFVQQFEQVLARYGARVGLFTQEDDGVNPVDYLTPWRAAPEQVLAMVSHYLPLARSNQGQLAANTPHTAREAARQEQQDKIDALCAATADRALVAQFSQQLAYARRSASFLDDHNHYIDQLTEGQFVQALLYAGRWLATRGDLPQPHAVFWLHPPEVLAALRAPAALAYGPTIAERKAQFAQWRTLLTPAYIGLPDPHLPAALRAASIHQQAGLERPPAPNTLTGQAVSGGKGLGRAHIIHDLVHLPALAAGDVLIAAQVNPLWTPLFPTLAAIVLDGGGPGDHAAITAREFGVPAIFGTGQATRRIPPGAWVTVDCATGVVTWA